MKQKQLTTEEVRAKLIERATVEYQNARPGMQKFVLESINAIGTEKVVWGGTSLYSLLTGWPYRWDTEIITHKINAWHFQLLNEGREEHQFEDDICNVCGITRQSFESMDNYTNPQIRILCQGYK